MTELLAGDIGGTKTILRWVEAASAPSSQEGQNCAAAQQAMLVEQTVLFELEYPSQSYDDLIPMVQEFLATATDKLGRSPQPQAACFAIAGPVVNNTSNLTNLGWQLTSDGLSKALSIAQVKLINDFAAIGYGIPGMGADDLFTLQDGEADPTAPIAVIGAGTGLGQCFVIPMNGCPVVFATEGGHSDYAPRTELEFRLLEYIEKSLSLTHVSAERIVSGQGVLSFYQFLRDRPQPGEEKRAEDPSVAAVVRAWETATDRDGLADPGAAIAQGAESNELCREALERFIEAYGAEASNLALKLLSYGGVYIAGGIASKNAERMKAGKFMEAFWDKGRMEPLLKRMPVKIILNRQVGLIGAALHAASLIR